MTLRNQAKFLNNIWDYRRQYSDVLRHMLSRKLGFSESVFTVIHNENVWGNKESVSGPGSTIDATKNISTALMEVIESYELESILDIPCGDFHWMSAVDLSVNKYVGADIVRELVQINQLNHKKQGIEFEHIDIRRDALPRSDLVFTRDLLLHLCNRSIIETIDNVVRSNSRYWMVSSTIHCVDNSDSYTGGTRAVNLQLAPFFLPPPLTVFNDGKRSAGLGQNNRMMGLWAIEDIRQFRNQGSMAK